MTGVQTYALPIYTLFALKDGKVKFERLGKDRKQVSIVEIAQ